MDKQGTFEKLEDGSVIYHPKIKNNLYKANGSLMKHPFYYTVKKSKWLNIYEAFDKMHKIDGLKK